MFVFQKLLLRNKFNWLYFVHVLLIWCMDQQLVWEQYIRLVLKDLVDYLLLLYDISTLISTCLIYSKSNQTLQQVPKFPIRWKQLHYIVEHNYDGSWKHELQHAESHKW